MRMGEGPNLTTRELALGAAEGFGGGVLSLEQGADGHHHLRRHIARELVVHMDLAETSGERIDAIRKVLEQYHEKRLWIAETWLMFTRAQRPYGFP